jgi:peptidoglycan/xylan/chitin deacetylase (PgdA/CDA1 family)
VNALRRWIGIILICFVLIFSLPTSPSNDVYYQNQIAVLAYHHIDDEAQSGVTISTRLFESQLADLKSRGYHFIDMDQFEKFFAGGSVPDNAVLVTFDDGYRSFYTNAYPILRKLHIPAINFVITKDLDEPNQTQIPSLSRDDIRTLLAAKKGMAFGCHSDALHSKSATGDPLLTNRQDGNGQKETDDQHRERIRKDTVTCIRKLRELGSDQADVYAYPFGYFDSESVDILRAAGIRYGFTTRSEMVTRDTDPMQIPRLNAGSPYVRSISVNNLILRKVAEHLHPDELVPLGKAMKQLGGTAKLLKNGEIELEYNDRIYRILTDRITVMIGPNGPDSLLLSQPVVLKDRHNYIRKQDLERLLEIRIMYNPVKDQYIKRESPAKDSNV